ncbi:MAG: zf-HC2 domain-containing protein [Acidobacteria bacterium]|nr:zf-HC2 domain-containing protein [Acidobacteriota bacterium]
MEHEFDKEIDGLLRGFGRAERPLRAEAGPHIDADQLAAFLEGALPSAARANLIAHTANCDACRAIFATAVDLNERPLSVGSAAAVPAFEPKRRWRFLGMPAFAAALSGLLVVVFAGLIGVRYFSRSGEANIVAQKSGDEDRRPAAAPETSANASAPAEQAPMPAANNVQANSNAAAAANTERVENPPVILPRSFAEAPAKDKAETDDLAKRDTESEKKLMSQPMASAEPSVAAEPKPETKDAKPGFQVDGASGGENVWTVDGKESVNDRSRSKSAPPASADSVLLRSQSAARTATRTVSGKTFTRRDGIWYDSAYKGGSTTDRAKTCDTCGVLEPNLQNIVNTLPGTVIVVWKGRNLKFY